MTVRHSDVGVLVAGDGQGAPGARPVPRRGHRRLLAVASAAVLVAGAAGWVLLRDEGAGPAGDRALEPLTGTAKVSRQDLVSRVDVDGTLGYGGERTVTNQLAGTVTVVPAQGAVISRGQSLYSIGNRSVPLLYGELPAWRAFSVGMSDGPDVRQLEQNLVALGHATEAELSVDEHFSSSTAAAIRRWQKALGVQQTGAVELGEAVFLPDAIRVSGVKLDQGAPAPPGAPALTVTSTTRLVTVDLEASKQSLVKVGDKVEVKIPGGRTTTGSITSVGTVAQPKGQGESAKQVIPVAISLDEAEAAGRLDQAPVKVAITANSRKGVLAVPVNALLALREGGYGVRLVEGANRRIVPVETGLFAKGMVEVSGNWLREGLDVEVPAS
jgi:peptidoglycan hydrolase-like protein with peptidoglycan-binding domain